MLSQLAGALSGINAGGAFEFTERQTRRGAAPNNFHDYLRETLPREWSADYPHIKLMAEHVDAVERGDIDRLLILAPPRHAKTETVTVRGSAYSLERNPSDNVLITAYNATFAKRLSRKARNIVSQRIEIASDKSSVDEWVTSAEGAYMARGVGSPPTGVGFRRIFIEDPIRSREDAESEIYRERLWDWYADDIYTRLEPQGAIIIVQTHWHYDDLAVRAPQAEPGRWHTLKLPAFALENDPLGRQPGEALWPERFDKDELERRREVMRREEGEYSFEALYQQNPLPRQGAIFKVANLQIVDVVPASAKKRVRAYDLAASTASGDYTVGVKISGPCADGLLYVEHVWRDRLDASERDKRMRQTAELDGTDVAIRLPQDPGQAGKSQVASLIRLLSGFTVRSVPVSGDKEVRANPFASQVNAGNVRLVLGSWNAAYIEELRQFPAGKYDDQVDASADCFNELTRSRVIYTAA